MLLALLLSLDPVAKPVAQATGLAVDKVTQIAKTVLIVAVGIFLFKAGIASLSIPPLGIALMVIGAGLVGWGAWSFFKRSPSPGQKPDPTKL